MGFLHIGQAGLELLTSDDPPTSASQSAQIIGVSHSTGQPIVYIFLYFFAEMAGYQGGLIMLPRLVSNPWTQVICLPCPLNGSRQGAAAYTCWDYRREPLHLAYALYFL